MSSERRVAWLNGRCLSCSCVTLLSFVSLSIALCWPGNASFPEETKLLFYHSRPQVFTAPCPSQERLLADANLLRLHNPPLSCQSAFSKALSLILFPLGKQRQFARTKCVKGTKRPCLSFFNDIESGTCVLPAQLWVMWERRAPNIAWD